MSSKYGFYLAIWFLTCLVFQFYFLVSLNLSIFFCSLLKDIFFLTIVIIQLYRLGFRTVSCRSVTRIYYATDPGVCQWRAFSTISIRPHHRVVGKTPSSVAADGFARYARLTEIPCQLPASASTQYNTFFPFSINFYPASFPVEYV